MLKSPIISHPRIWNCDWQHFLNNLTLKTFYSTLIKNKNKNQSLSVLVEKVSVEGQGLPSRGLWRETEGC